MSTRSEASDLAVDELKRRARRRLVGAIVLALAAAVLLPLLLESEPKPLGDEVSIQIPPIDSGKFVNPLSPEKSAPPPEKKDEPAAKAAGPTGTAAPASTEVSPSNEARPAATEPRPAPAQPPAEAKPEPAPATPKTEAKAVPPAAETKPEAAPAAPKTETKPAPPTKDGNAGGNAFVIQVAAFTDRYGALALVRKLKQAGFPGYTEPVTTDRGSLHRVRVGPYGSREAAEAARVKLKAAGYDALVARAP